MSQQPATRGAMSSTARHLTGWARPTLRLVHQHRSTAPRAPFVALVLGLLGAAMIGLLMLSTALQHNAFVLDDMSSEMTQLRDRQAELSGEVAERSAPGSLAEQAQRAGMTPAEEPELLEVEPGSRSGGDSGSSQ